MKLEPQPPCERTRRELAAYLYDELDARTRSAVDEHLAVCPPCQGELAESRATLNELGTWQLPAGHADQHDDPRALAERTRALAQLTTAASSGRPSRRRGRLVRLSATATAAAAALLVGLALLGADLTVRDGAFHLRLGMPWAAEELAPLTAIPAPQVLEPELRRIAAEEFTTRAVSFEERQAELLRSWSRERQNLVQAVDFSQAEDRRAIRALTGLIDELSRRQVLQDRRTKDALVELTEAVFDLHE